MKLLPQIVILIISLVNDYAIYRLDQKRDQKRLLYSGVVLTLGGLIYSTVKTKYIIKHIKMPKN
ncbi:hypothetical protein [Bacillus infantis]|uniref:Uncharacterized protein n=1 Tax=Bacillus infantis TaxID=324767 RepID=A0A5D4RJP3_9BACI|nr:hypothetical protein [Bacillus infantis]TYS50076.1 hypothetical protein FZD51_05845 [Bacillus infantis]